MDYMNHECSARRRRGGTLDEVAGDSVLPVATATAVVLLLLNLLVYLVKNGGF